MSRPLLSTMYSLMDSRETISQPWQEVLVYGAGGFGSTIRPLLETLGAHVVGVIDRRASSDESSALTAAQAFSEYGDLPVILGVFSPQPNVHEISQHLSSIGFSNVVSPPRLMHLLSDFGVRFRRYWLSSYTEDLRLPNIAIEAVFNSLRDPSSRDTFQQLICYRLSGDIKYSPIPLPLDDQYVGSRSSFLETASSKTFVDCGAFTGDSILNWERAGAQPSTVFALEPDPSNFNALVATLDICSTSVIPFRVGVSNQSGLFSLEGDGPSATLVNSPNGSVQCTTIDELVGSEHVSLIKMDIEGSEMSALQGATKTISRDHPHLAISVYHRPADLWEIPAWITYNFPGYRLSLATYGHQGYDTVLYATWN